MNFDAEITSVAFGGKGIARVAGKVWFVKGTVPGDVVRVRPLESKEHFGEGEVELFLTRSSLRSEKPPCPVFGQCGGCQWQDIPYETQLEWKKSFLADSLQRVGKIKVEELTIEASPHRWNYRSRVLVRVHVDSKGAVSMGYFKGETRELVAIKKCDLASPSLNTFLGFVAELKLPENRGESFRLEIQEIQTEAPQNLWVTVFPTKGKTQDLKALLERVKRHPQVSWVGSVFELETALPQVFESDLGIDFVATPGQFQQINVPHNHNLRRHVLSYAQKQGWKRILDVFCGSGNLSLPLAKGSEYVAGVELNPKSIKNAKASAAMNELGNTHWVACDAVAHLNQLARQKKEAAGESSGSAGGVGPLDFDVILLDPPREGFFKGLSSLIALNPKAILYVSCDPVTLARDIGWLTKNGYRVEKIICLDFFPNTYHVESLAFLQRDISL